MNTVGISSNALWHARWRQYWRAYM